TRAMQSGADEAGALGRRAAAEFEMVVKRVSELTQGLERSGDTAEARLAALSGALKAEVETVMGSADAILAPCEAVAAGFDERLKALDQAAGTVREDMGGASQALQQDATALAKIADTLRARIGDFGNVARELAEALAQRSDQAFRRITDAAQQLQRSQD